MSHVLQAQDVPNRHVGSARDRASRPRTEKSGEDIQLPSPSPPSPSLARSWRAASTLLRGSAALLHGERGTTQTSLHYILDTCLCQESSSSLFKEAPGMYPLPSRSCGASLRRRLLRPVCALQGRLGPALTGRELPAEPAPLRPQAPPPAPLRPPPGKPAEGLPRALCALQGRGRFGFNPPGPGCCGAREPPSCGAGPTPGPHPGLHGLLGNPWGDPRTLR